MKAKRSHKRPVGASALLNCDIPCTEAFLIIVHSRKRERRWLRGRKRCLRTRATLLRANRRIIFNPNRIKASAPYLRNHFKPPVPVVLTSPVTRNGCLCCLTRQPGVKSFGSGATWRSLDYFAANVRCSRSPGRYLDGWFHLGPAPSRAPRLSSDPLLKEPRFRGGRPRAGRNVPLTCCAPRMCTYRRSLSRLSVRVAQNRFKRFQSGNFDVKDEPRSGRPVTDEIDVIGRSRAGSNIRSAWLKN
ncbi:hypothetical protein EVAR_103884_1 [Eumeta japonica]|uniref:Uncharacterized protein n=1 Tax=Eumeta variegata TaxID=151549 RepID=A0A4C1ZP25_EUMVA|nr:hypothetical protein EVAR_103884_1 [Eumeta japonica]